MTIPIYIGSDPVVKVYVGSSEAEAIYVGADKVWPTGGAYVGPLDIVPGAVVAYGQRAMSAATRGTALYTIRRDSDNATQSFNSDAVTGDGPIAAITAFLGGANPFVQIFNDQSGNGVNVEMDVYTPPAPELQCKFLAVASNGRSALTGVVGDAGTAILESVKNMPALNAVTSFHVMRFIPYTKGLQQRIFSSASLELSGYIDASLYGPVDAPYIYFDSSTDDGNHEQGNATEVNTAFVDNWILVEFKVATDVIEIRVNGVVQPLTGEFGDGVFGPMTGDVSCQVAAIDVDNDLNRYRQEDIIYSSLLSDADRLAIRQNIAAYYGIMLP